MGSDARINKRPELPCAACRMLHRKCSRGCILAPHFPTDRPDKFLTVHKVFGASNVIKMLQIVAEASREDAVKSLVYEAKARLLDPVYGSTSAINYLQDCIQQLQAQLKTTQDEIMKAQEQNSHLLRFLMEMPFTHEASVNNSSINSCQIYDI